MNDADFPPVSRRRGNSTAARIEDVAQEAGVSIMSVSRAMRGVEGVSPTTRARILEVAETLGYSPSSVAGSLAAANSTLIGISVPTLHDEVFSDLFEAMRTIFSRAGFQTVFDTTEYEQAREGAWVERMMAWRLAGLVLSGADHSETTRRVLRRSPMPVLELWDYTQTPIDMVVGIDHFAAGLDMGRALVERGYTRPAWIGAEAGYDSRAEQRLDGFTHAFTDAGNAAPIIIPLPRPHSFEGGQAGARRALERRSEIERPDVLYCLNDYIAFGALVECEAHGLTIPGDIGIAGFNDLSLNRVLPSPITTSRTPRRMMGEEGARMLVGRILGVPAPPPCPMPVDIVMGATTR